MLRRLLDLTLLVLRWAPVILLTAAFSGGAVYLLGRTTETYEAEGQVGVGNGASFFDLDPMQTAVELDLTEPEFMAELIRRAPAASAVSFSADRSLGTRSFITITVTAPDSQQQALDSLDNALALLVERYNAANAFDPSALTEARATLQAEAEELDQRIEALIAQEALDINNRTSDTAAYERYELARNERFQLERERNSVLDRINSVDGQLLAPQLETSPQDELRILLPARTIGDDGSGAFAAIAVAAGVVLAGVLLVAHMKRDALPLRMQSDLALLTQSPVVTATKLDPDEVTELVGDLRRGSRTAEDERSVVTVTPDGSIDLPQDTGNETVLVFTSGAQSIAATRELVNKLHGLDVAITAAVLTK